MILWGGYPELYAKALSENKKMRQAVRRAIREKLPCIAECGGFLYLQAALQDMEGGLHQMAEVFPGIGLRGVRLGRFGYINAELREGCLFGRKSMKIRAHEFHYFDCETRGEAFAANKASGEGGWLTGVADDCFYGGFPHIYFYGNEAFAEGFLDQAKDYRTHRSEKT